MARRPPGHPVGSGYRAGVEATAALLDGRDPPPPIERGIPFDPTEPLEPLEPLVADIHAEALPTAPPPRAIDPD